MLDARRYDRSTEVRSHPARPIDGGMTLRVDVAPALLAWASFCNQGPKASKG